MDDGKEFCLCSVCRGRSRLSERTIRRHLKEHGIHRPAAVECRHSSTPSEFDQASEFEHANDEQMEALVSSEEDVHAGVQCSGEVDLECN